MGERKERSLERRKLMGRRLRGMRVAQNLSLDEVGSLLGKQRAVMSLYETAKRAIDFDVFVEYCKLLNVSADYILGIIDEPRPIQDPKKIVVDKEVSFDEMPRGLQRVLISLGRLVLEEKKEDGNITRKKG
ncbi:MAG: helix-turn-helix domain-containing protein [Peptococcaceae bacterium]|jgi:transcriptional regulator with XRE-family HTH domain|nr:helix-turn-helix domain-containing protein [Peptococcaceae bacterium]